MTSICLTVFRFLTSSNLVGSLTARSVDFVPFRILSSGSVKVQLNSHLGTLLINPSDAEPSIVIRLQLDEVAAVLVSAAVVLREQIYEFAGARISGDGSTVEHDGGALAVKLCKVTSVWSSHS